MSTNKLLLISSVSGFIGVSAGAFGSHILKDHLTPEMLDIYKTGVLYQLIHSVVILVISLSLNEKLYKSAIFFIIGILLFSFSLYVYSITSIKMFAMITPLGGISFLVGWIMLIIQGLKKEN